MFDRLANSFELAQSSWRVLRSDKKLLIFPILSGMGCLLVMGGFALPFLFLPDALDFLRQQGQNGPPWWVYPLAFAYYFCSYFVVIFFNSALVSCALLRFNGEEPTLDDGLRAAASRLPQILAWAAVSATVGVLLKAVENVHEKAGALISALLGTAWTVVTYFVVPVLVVEKVGPFQAIQRSLSLLRQTWGEALVGKAGIGLVMFVLLIPGIVLFVLALAAFSTSAALGLTVVGLAVLYVIVWAAAGSALSGIFLSALYQYAAHGEVPTGFRRGVIEQAFAPK